MDAVLAGIAGFLLGGPGALFLDKAYSGATLLGSVTACTHCGRPAGLLDAFPALPALPGRGACTACGQRVPRRFLALPPASAAVAAAGWLTGDTTVDRLLALAFGIVFLLLITTDLERRLLPNRIIYPAMVAALLVSPLWADRGLVGALAGAGLGFGLMLGPYLVMPGGLGAGDVKLAALMGAVLGIPGILVGLGVGILMGGVGAALVLLLRRSRRMAIAYGPFLAAGALVALWWSTAIAEWYTGS